MDIPDIRVVVHVDTPDSLRDYAQESGRAGRDGKASRAIIFSKPLGSKDKIEEQERTNIYIRSSMQLPG